jgi:hypothetical protein
MRTSIEFEMIKSNTPQTHFSIFKLPKIDGFFLFSEMIFKASRHFPTIVISLASLKILFVVNDIYGNNLGFAILNSIFLIGDFFFLVRLYHMRRTYQKNSIYTSENRLHINGFHCGEMK